MSLPLIISSNIFIVLSMPIVIATAVLMFQREIYAFDLNAAINKKILSGSINTLTYILAAQFTCNLISMAFFEPVDKMADYIPIVIFYSIVFAPILEEYVFRKIIFGLLQGNKQRFSILAATTSSLLFAIMHFNIYGFLGYLAVGMVLSYSYYKQKSLVMNILAHTYVNFLVIFINSLKQYI